MRTRKIKFYTTSGHNVSSLDDTFYKISIGSNFNEICDFHDSRLQFKSTHSIKKDIVYYKQKIRTFGIDSIIDYHKENTSLDRWVFVGDNLSGFCSRHIIANELPIYKNEEVLEIEGTRIGYLTFTENEKFLIKSFRNQLEMFLGMDCMSHEHFLRELSIELKNSEKIVKFYDFLMHLQDFK